MSDVYRPKPLVGVSTKMYFSAQHTQAYISDLVADLKRSVDLFDKIDVFFIPDHVTLASCIASVAGTKIMIGAQDCFYEDEGAYTGEVSPAVLKEVGCQIVELGHAERRRIFGETDADTAKKAAAVAKNGMIPLVCIGEKTQGEVPVAVDECRIQVEAVLKAVPNDSEVIFAYEPVWAIGKAEPAGAEHVVGVTKRIREMASGRPGTVRILYGGSAGPGLFEKLAEGVDGLFLGRFAHQVDRFLKTILEVKTARAGT